MPLFALLAVALAGQNPPTNLQVEQATAPTAVTDHRPDFQARNGWSTNANRYQIQVSTDSTFATITHWNSPGPGGGTSFPGGGNLASGALCPQISYRNNLSLTTNPLLDWNTTYFWRIRMRRSSDSSWSGFSSSQFTMAAPSQAVSLHQTNGSPSADSWRFVGVPIAFGTTVPASELLDDVSLLYRLDEPSRTWIPMTAADVLEGGRGYLAWCGPAAVLDLSQGRVTPGIPAAPGGGASTTTPSYNLTNLSFTTLAAPAGQEVIDGVPANEYRGNILFVNPFYAPLSWKSSTAGVGAPYGHVARAGISYATYKWDGAQYVTYNGVTHLGSAGEWIEPFQAVGVWVQSASHQLWINTPPPLTGGAFKTMAALAAPPASTANGWALTIHAASGGAVDTENIAGLHFEADDAWDVRDSEEPGPGTASWILLSFDHRSDWTVYPRKYTHDFKKTAVDAGDVVSWTLTLDGNTNLPATLTWPDVAGLPTGDWSYTLENPANGDLVDLATASSYVTPAGVAGPQTLLLKATRLNDLLGSLSVTASAGASAPATAVGGATGVSMLELDVQAATEPVIVDSFGVSHQGTGDPAAVSVSLFAGNVRIAGPSSFTGGALLWTGLGRSVGTEAPETWKVVYDFAASASGTYRAVAEVAQAAGQGLYSARAIAAAGGPIAGAETTVSAAASSGGGSCGLLGLDVLLLLALLRRARRRRAPAESAAAF